MRSVIVFGDSHGIGYAASKAFLKAGYHVYGCASNREDPRGHELVMANKNWRHEYVDIAAEKQVESFLERTEQDIGGSPDAVLICAGLGYARRSVTEMDDREARRVMEVNLLGPAYVLKYSIPHLRKAGGMIAFCGSIAADTLDTGADWAYGATKAGAARLFQEAAADPKNNRIRFVEFRLGYIKTRMTAADDQTQWLRKTPYAQAGTPEEIAALMLKTVEDTSLGQYTKIERKGGGYPVKPPAFPKPVRSAGMLMPVFSLPNAYGCGSLGPEARQFIDILVKGGFRYWMMLPLNTTGYGDSPYAPVSAMAGSVNLISPELLEKEGLLSENARQLLRKGEDSTRVDYGGCYRTRPQMLSDAYARFREGYAPMRVVSGYDRFCQENEFWLEDYATFMAIKLGHGGKAWWEWEEPGLRGYEPKALEEYRKAHEEDVAIWKFGQFLFYRQLETLRDYAHSRGVRLIGDIPHYIAADSVDVWGHREFFSVNSENGEITEYSGVPADDFEPNDRIWGTPTYQWENHKKDGFQWWRNRIRFQAQWFDGLRIDHVIGFLEYYAIPANGSTGVWKAGPDTPETDEEGRILQAIQNEAMRYETEIIAEDLGIKIPKGLREQMDELGWSGMRVLQFAYKIKNKMYNIDSHHLPMYYSPNMMAFTGTHDNPPLMEFLNGKHDEELNYMKYMLLDTHDGGNDGNDGSNNGNLRRKLHWALILDGYRSVASYFTLPAQDALDLGPSGTMMVRMDYTRSWRWRMQNFDGLLGRCEKLRAMAHLSGRLSSP